MAKVSQQIRQAERTINSFMIEASMVLQKALKSESAFDRAVQKVTAMAEKLHSYIQKNAPQLLSDDHTPMGILAEVSGSAMGTNTIAQANLTARIVETDLVSIAVASSLSFASARGGSVDISSTTFTEIFGADFSFTKTRNYTANDFEYSKEVLVAVDLEFLEGYGGNLVREVNYVSQKARGNIDNGNFATAEFHLTASAENTLVVVDSHTLVVAGALSTAFIGAELFTS